MKNQDEKAGKYKIKVLDKALKVLELFDERGKELTVTEINDHLKFNKVSTFRIVKNLEDAGYLEKDADTLKYSTIMPEFHIINSCEVSNTKGYHDGNGWVDIDNDSDLDLIITNSISNNKPNLMFRNERGELFVRIKNTDYTMQSVRYGLPGPFGDIDNDGDEDLILAEWQGKK